MCPACGAKAQCVRSDRSFVEAVRKEYGEFRVCGELWRCGECNKGWMYEDGVLSRVGHAWRVMETERIPAGALAVLGEETA